MKSRSHQFVNCPAYGSSIARYPEKIPASAKHPVWACYLVSETLVLQHPQHGGKLVFFTVNVMVILQVDLSNHWQPAGPDQVLKDTLVSAPSTSSFIMSISSLIKEDSLRAGTTIFSPLLRSRLTLIRRPPPMISFSRKNSTEPSWSVKAQL